MNQVQFRKIGSIHCYLKTSFDFLQHVDEVRSSHSSPERVSNPTGKVNPYTGRSGSWKDENIGIAQLVCNVKGQSLLKEGILSNKNLIYLESLCIHPIL